jgi:hypothetical protein
MGRRAEGTKQLIGVIAVSGPIIGAGVGGAMAAGGAAAGGGITTLGLSSGSGTAATSTVAGLLPEAVGNIRLFNLSRIFGDPNKLNHIFQLKHKLNLLGNPSQAIDRW